VYRWVDHTGEAELAIDAATLDEVFADALAAYGALVGEGATGEPVDREVSLEAADVATLLADWVGELVFLAETDDFIPERVTALELAGPRLHARVAGRRGAPSHLVKAVTYHGLRVEQKDGGWHAELVLDV
jgi:SHS2 domain-containing protein